MNSPKIKRAFQARLTAWYRKNQRDLPWRRICTPYRSAVAELMCQQTQIATVLPYYQRWMTRFPDWKSLARAGEPAVLKHWEGLGYYRRARLLHALAKEVVKLPGKELPPDFERLKKLPGIGSYTAGAIGSIAFGLRVPLVDGNVERVLCRVFEIRREISKKELESLAESLLPKKNCGDFNQALMELGALVCTPRKPKCGACPLKNVCSAREKNPESLPVKKRPETVAEAETLALLRKSEKVWLELPENPRRWKGFYRLPFFDSKKMQKGRELAQITYTITRYRIRAVLVSVEWKQNASPPPTGRWFSPRELNCLSLPAPHRRLLKGTSKN